MFSFGAKFMEIWTEIPTINDYWDYIGIANDIDNAKIGREITERDEKTLLDVLEIFKVARGIMDQ